MKRIQTLRPGGASPVKPGIAQPGLAKAGAAPAAGAPRPAPGQPQPPRAAARSVAAPGLKVDHIGKSFGARAVVKSVSLTLNRGEVVGLLGPNGAGKTTCFYMITGLIPVDYGVILLDGEDVTAQPMYQRARMGIGYLPQETSIFRGLTVQQNIAAVVELREKERGRIGARVKQLLDELRISHLADAPAVSLSGGERRRVEIARALASEPSFMLLDEPFAGIDPMAIADIRSLIAYLKARGIGILITDHNVRETLGIIDRASIIHDGEVLREGSAEEIMNDPEVRRVYLGSTFS